MKSNLIVRSLLAVSMLCIGVTMFSAVPASSQQDDRDHRLEAALFPSPLYAGQPRTIRGENPNMHLPGTINSVRIVRGEWLLCELPEYQGRCHFVNRDIRLMGGNGVAIRSARPISITPLPIAVGTPNVIGTGNFAEFHPRPVNVSGHRLLACRTGEGEATPACAARAADRFCRDRGWGGSAREYIEMAGGSALLADVLCVRSGY